MLHAHVPPESREIELERERSQEGKAIWKYLNHKKQSKKTLSLETAREGGAREARSTEGRRLSLFGLKGGDRPVTGHRERYPP